MTHPRVAAIGVVAEDLDEADGRHFLYWIMGSTPDYNQGNVHLGTLMVLVLAAQPGPRFEVAALKPSAPGGGNGGMRPAPGGEQYLATNVSLRLMLAVAYRINDDQIVGGPDWMNSEKFDMNAKATGPSTIEELHVMLQNLLAERFKLQFHRGTKERPVYALMVDKGTLRMQPRGGQHRMGSY